MSLIETFARRAEHLTTALATLNRGVRPATIRDWRRRGLLTPCGGTPNRPPYRLKDVDNARRTGTGPGPPHLVPGLRAPPASRRR